MSATMRDPLKCGGCGGEEFKLSYEHKEGTSRFGGGGRHTGVIIVRCLKCNSESKISPAPAGINVEGDAHGTLCGGWG